MEKSIDQVIKYFTYFQYPPDIDQIYTFLSKRVSPTKLQQVLDKMVGKGKLLTFNFKLLTLYTMPPHRIFFLKRQQRETFTKHKEKIADHYLKALSFFPQIKLIGYSGSMALFNANEKDDIDLFIISDKNRLWTARFISHFLAFIFNIRRHRLEKNPKNKVCLNLYFDERSLAIVKSKQNHYIAHEVLQMRPIIAKGDIYQKFLGANRWIYHFFPNPENKVKGITKKEKVLVLPFTFYVLRLIGDGIELILKTLQLYLVNRHKTTEIITDTQLWFFPEDFEKTLNHAKLNAKQREICHCEES